MGPPKALDWPKPMSSISTTRTLAAPAGAFTSNRNGGVALRASTSVIGGVTGPGRGSTVRSVGSSTRAGATVWAATGCSVSGASSSIRPKTIVVDRVIESLPSRCSLLAAPFSHDGRDGSSGPWSRASLNSTASRDGPRRQRLDVGADGAGARQPHPIRMLEDVLQRAAQPADAVRPAGNERMERDRAHERLAGRLREQLVELVDDELGELVRGVVIPDDPARVVHLDRVWHGEDPALARADPDGLIVHRPVHRVPGAPLPQQY